MSKNVKVLGWTPFAYENITITSAVVSMLNETHRNDAGAIFLTLENNNISYRIDSEDPTSVLGHHIVSASRQNLWLDNGSSIRNLRMIAIGNDALVKVTYYRKR